MDVTKLLSVRGGERALARVQERGFQPDDVKAMLGASGGPKWFVLSGLDRALLGETFRDRSEPLHLLGSSAGCWRFSCYARNNPLAALDRFEQAYINSNFARGQTPRQVTEDSREFLQALHARDGAGEIINNAVMRLNLIVVKALGPVSSSNAKIQMAGLLAAAAGNAVHRRLMGLLFQRILFTHPLGGFPVRTLDDLPSRRVELSEQNLDDAVLASGSIPLVLEGVRDIAGAGPGLYLDGGVTDYHFDLPVEPDDGLVLYPHFRERPVPGWFDKSLPWRKPSARHYRDTLLLTPTPEFVSRLPYGKIPDRKDFLTLDADSRKAYWRTVVSESRRLGDAWLELVEKQQLSAVAQPLNF